MDDRMFLGFCDGWNIPAHESDDITCVQKPSGAELCLCDRCLVEYRKDFPRLNYVEKSLTEMRKKSL